MLSENVSALRRRLPLYIVAAASLLLFGRLCIFVNKNAVNILFWDQWDFYTPLFDGSSAWTIFRWQHGPHRQGIGFLLDSWLAPYTGWNSRAEAFVIAAIMFAAMCAALALKKRLFGAITFSDLIIPPLFMTLGNYEMLIGPSNPSHGSMPLLLFMLYCLAWTVKRPPVKYPLLVVINFLLIYTGFGLFAGFINVLLLAAESVIRIRSHSDLRWPLIALGASALALASFFFGYTKQPAVECFQFPHSNLLAYPWYAALILANFVHSQGARLWPSLVGMFLLALFVWAFAVCGFKLWRSGFSDVRSVVIVTLISFSLLFVLTAAIGRVCLGMESATASRYVPYVAPAFVAFYFFLLTLSPHRWRTASLLALCLASFYAGTHLTRVDRGAVYWLREGKAAWRACYLAREDIDRCTKTAVFAVSPHPAASRLKEKLEFLKQNRLNLYAPE